MHLRYQSGSVATYPLPSRCFNGPVVQPIKHGRLRNEDVQQDCSGYRGRGGPLRIGNGARSRPDGGASSMAAHGFAQGDCKGPSAGTMVRAPHERHAAWSRTASASRFAQERIEPQARSRPRGSVRAAVREQFATMSKAQGQPGAATGNPEAHIQFMEQRLESMKAVAKARAELLKTLTPEQKAAFGAPPRPFQHRVERGTVRPGRERLYRLLSPRCSGTPSRIRPAADVHTNEQENVLVPAHSCVTHSGPRAGIHPRRTRFAPCL